MKNLLRILAKAALFLIVAGLLSSCFLKTNQPSKESLPPTETPLATPTPLVFIPSSDPVLGWKTYTNQEYNFEIKYPPEWTPKSGDNGQKVWVF